MDQTQKQFVDIIPRLGPWLGSAERAVWFIGGHRGGSEHQRNYLTTLPRQRTEHSNWGYGYIGALGDFDRHTRAILEFLREELLVEVLDSGQEPLEPEDGQEDSDQADLEEEFSLEPDPLLVAPIEEIAKTVVELGKHTRVQQPNSDPFELPEGTPEQDRLDNLLTQAREVCEKIKERATDGIASREPVPPPLSDDQRLILRILQELEVGKALTGKEIQAEYKKQHGEPPSQSTLTRHIIPHLKKYYWVANKNGYYISKRDHPPESE